MLWPKVELGVPTCQAGRPARVAERPSFLTAPALGIDALCTDLLWHVGRAEFEKAPTPGRPVKEVGSTGPTLAQLGLGFVPHHPLVIFSVTMPYFWHIEDMNRFWSIWCFSVISCSGNGRSTKLMELVSNKHLSSISWMKCRYAGDKYMHFMTSNTPHTHA
jgi:hypothetical protein